MILLSHGYRLSVLLLYCTMKNDFGMCLARLSVCPNMTISRADDDSSIFGTLAFDDSYCIRRDAYRYLTERQYDEYPDGCELRVLVRRRPQSSDATLHGLGDVVCLVVNVYAYGRSVGNSDEGHYMYMLSRPLDGSVDFESEVYTLLSSAWLLLPKTVGYDWPMERASRMADALESRGYVSCDYDLSDM